MRRSSLELELGSANTLTKIKGLLDPQSIAHNVSKDARNTLLKNVWVKEALPHWDKDKPSTRVRKLVWHGIPSSIRGTVWKIIIGNDLALTAGE